MEAHNNGVGELNILQNEFTAYLVTAIRRQKWRYLKNKESLQVYEKPFKPNEFSPELQYEPDFLETMPILTRLEDSKLRNLLKKQKERNRYIFFAKILDECSFIEIAAELKMDYKAVTSIYYRMIAKFKKELRGDEE